MKKCFLFLALITVTLSNHAEIYKWIDEDGNVHFSDSQNTPPQQQNETISLEINTYTSVSYESVTSTTDQVTMYSTEWCGYCKRARNYFIANDIAFVEYDIEKNKKAEREYKRLGGQGVPVILYKDRRMNGFSAAGFKRFYEANI